MQYLEWIVRIRFKRTWKSRKDIVQNISFSHSPLFLYITVNAHLWSSLRRQFSSKLPHITITPPPRRITTRRHGSISFSSARHNLSQYNKYSGHVCMYLSIQIAAVTTIVHRVNSLSVRSRWSNDNDWWLAPLTHSISGDRAHSVMLLHIMFPCFCNERK